MEVFNPGDLVFAKVTSRGPPWPAVVAKYLGNQLYQVRCFGTDTMADVKATAIIAYSTYSLARFDTNRNRKIKQFLLALDLIREKREECGCSSGCSIPRNQRKKVKLTVCKEGENEMVDIDKLKVVKKGKTPNKTPNKKRKRKTPNKTPNKKRKAVSVSAEKEGVNGRGMEKEVVVNGTVITEKKVNMDPKAPKKPFSPFISFCRKERPKVKLDFPDLDLKTTNQVLRKRWSVLSEDRKKIYEAKYRVDETNYKMAVAKSQAGNSKGMYTSTRCRLVESRKGEPFSFLAANLKGCKVSVRKLMENANFPTVVILSNTGLVVGEDLTWSGYRHLRRPGRGDDGDLLLYYMSHLMVEDLRDRQSEQNEMLWFMLTGCTKFKSSKGIKERTLIMGYLYGEKVSTEDFLGQFKQNLEIIKERFGDVDVLVQGSTVNRNAVKEMQGESGLVSHQVGDGKIFLTSPGVEFRSVKVRKEERGFDTVLAHMENTSCVVCKVEFGKYDALKKHLDTPEHQWNHCFNTYQWKSKELLKNPHGLGLEMSILCGDPGVEMSPDESGSVLVQTSPGVAKNFTILMKNTAGEMEQMEDGSKADIVITAIYFLRTDPAFKVTDKYEIFDTENVEGRKKIRVPFGRSYEANITCLSSQRGYYKMPLIITFYHKLRSNKVTLKDEKRFALSYMALEVLLNVETDGDMFKKVTLTDPLEDKFRLAQNLYLSVSGEDASTIESIDYVENSVIMQKFVIKKNEFKSKGTDLKERLLFHGTNNVNVDSILRQNFRLDYAGQHGQAYGRGIYFSDETKILNKYMNREKRTLLLCRVLLGNKFLGTDRGIPVGFDSKSVKPNEDRQASFIVIKDVDQILPCFVITLAPSIRFGSVG